MKRCCLQRRIRAEEEETRNITVLLLIKNLITGFKSESLLSFPTRIYKQEEKYQLDLLSNAFFIFARSFLSYLFVPSSLSFSFSFFLLFFTASRQSSSSPTFLQLPVEQERAFA